MASSAESTLNQPAALPPVCTENLGSGVAEERDAEDLQGLTAIIGGVGLWLIARCM
jgi:hypothetical protein